MITICFDTTDTEFRYTWPNGYVMKFNMLDDITKKIDIIGFIIASNSKDKLYINENNLYLNNTCVLEGVSNYVSVINDFIDNLTEINRDPILYRHKMKNQTNKIVFDNPTEFYYKCNGINLGSFPWKSGNENSKEYKRYYRSNGYNYKCCILKTMRGGGIIIVSTDVYNSMKESKMDIRNVVGCSCHHINEILDEWTKYHKAIEGLSSTDPFELHDIYMNCCKC